MSTVRGPIPAANDGGTTIIINTADGCADVWSSKNDFHKHHKHHKGMHSAKPKNSMFGQPSTPKADTTTKTAE